VGDTAVLGGVGEGRGDCGPPCVGTVGDLAKLSESRRNRLVPRSAWHSGRAVLCGGCCGKRPMLAVLARRAWAVAGISESRSSSSNAGMVPNLRMKG